MAHSKPFIANAEDAWLKTKLFENLADWSHILKGSCLELEPPANTENAALPQSEIARRMGEKPADLPVSIRLSFQDSATFEVTAGEVTSVASSVFPPITIIARRRRRGFFTKPLNIC